MRIIQEKFDEMMATMLPSGSKVAVAVSGGADSLALCHLLGYSALSYDIYCVTVDHGLRQESALEAAATSELLRGRGFKSEILKWEYTIRPSSNIHYHARKARYDLLRNYCKEHGIVYLATGHHLNDNAETVLMNILRGSGVRGIAGIRRINQVDDHLVIIRPLLSFMKTELESYLMELDIQWVNDPSNFDEQYQRNAVRSLFSLMAEKNLPASLTKEDILGRFALLAANASRTEDYLKECTIEQIMKVTYSHNNIILIDRKALVNLHEEMGLRILRELLFRVGGKEYTVRLDGLVRTYRNLISEGPNLACTIGGCLIQRMSTQKLRRLVVADSLLEQWVGAILKGSEVTSPIIYLMKEDGKSSAALPIQEE